MACTTEPSTWPFALAMTAPMTFPMSCIDAAPVAAIASSTSASTASDSWAGAYAAITSRSDRSRSASSVRPACSKASIDSVRFFTWVPATPNLVVGELVADLVLLVADRRDQHAQAPSGTSSRAFMAVICSWICDFNVDAVTTLLPMVLAELPRSLLVGVGAVAVLGVACVVYGVAIERRWYRLVRHRLDILPTDGDGPQTLTVLHLSDLHFVRHDDRKARFLAGLPQADVTVVTGISSPSRRRSRPSWRPCGRFGDGSRRGSCSDPTTTSRLAHSTTSPTRPGRKRRRNELGRAPELVERLVADGWQDLTNVRRALDLDGLPVELLGLDDAHIRWHDSAWPRARSRSGSASP